MNMFGRVFGGLLVLISLGWLASIAGIRPGGLASNQIDGNQQTGTANAPTQTGVTPANATTPVYPVKAGTQVGASKFTTGQSTSGQTAAGKPEVEENPRGVGNGTNTVDQNAHTSGTETAPIAPPPEAAPVAAGW